MCTSLCLVSGPDIGNHYKHQTYTVASGTSVTGSVFMRRSRLFLGQCTLYLRFFSKVFPTFLDLFFSQTDPWTNLRINRLYMYNTSKKNILTSLCYVFFFLAAWFPYRNYSMKILSPMHNSFTNVCSRFTYSFHYSTLSCNKHIQG